MTCSLILMMIKSSIKTFSWHCWSSTVSYISSPALKISTAVLSFSLLPLLSGKSSTRWRIVKQITLPSTTELLKFYYLVLLEIFSHFFGNFSSSIIFIYYFCDSFVEKINFSLLWLWENKLWNAGQSKPQKVKFCWQNVYSSPFIAVMNRIQNISPVQEEV